MILSKNKEIRISLELPVHDALDEKKYMKNRNFIKMRFMFKNNERQIN